MEYSFDAYLQVVSSRGYLQLVIYIVPSRGTSTQQKASKSPSSPSLPSPHNNQQYYFKPYCHVKHAGKKHTSWHNSKRAKCPAPSPKFGALITYYKNRTTICLQTLRLWRLSNQFWHEEHESLSTAISLNLVHLNYFKKKTISTISCH